MVPQHLMDHIYPNTTNNPIPVLPKRPSHQSSWKALGNPGNRHPEKHPYPGTDTNHHLLSAPSRQGHLFFALGFTGSWAIILTFRKVTTKIRILSTASMLFIIAFFTEFMKLFIEGRHYSFPQCLEGFFFGMLGYLCIGMILYLTAHHKDRIKKNAGAEA